MGLVLSDFQGYAQSTAEHPKRRQIHALGKIRALGPACFVLQICKSCAQVVSGCRFHRERNNSDRSRLRAPLDHLRAVCSLITFSAVRSQGEVRPDPVGVNRRPGQIFCRDPSSIPWLFTTIVAPAAGAWFILGLNQIQASAWLRSGADLQPARSIPALRATATPKPSEFQRFFHMFSLKTFKSSVYA